VKLVGLPRWEAERALSAPTSAEEGEGRGDMGAMARDDAPAGDAEGRRGPGTDRAAPGESALLEAIRLHAAQTQKLPAKLEEITIVPVPSTRSTAGVPYRLEGGMAELRLPVSRYARHPEVRYEITLADGDYDPQAQGRVFEPLDRGDTCRDA